MKNYLYLSLLVLLSACSTTKNINLKPIAQETRFIDGHEVVKQEQEGIKIVTAYDGTFDKYYTFDTEIFNLSDQPLTVSPTDFVAYSLQSTVDTGVVYSNVPLSQNGLDPTLEARKAADDMQKARRRHTLNSILNIVLVVGAVALESSSKSNRNDRGFSHAQTINNIVQLGVAKQAIDNNLLVYRMDKLAYEKGNWQAETFVKNTLQPHTSMRGRVYIPVMEYAKFLKFSYPTHQGSINFMFEQTLTENR